MAASRVKFKIEVYNITAASGYKSGSNAISPTVTDDSENEGDARAVTDADCEVHFIGARYDYDNMPATDGTDALTAVDLSAVFNRKTYADVDAAKSAIINSGLATAISNNCAAITYTLDSNNLILDCTFADDTKRGNMITALHVMTDSTSIGWSAEPGAVMSTIS